MLGRVGALQSASFYPPVLFHVGGVSQRYIGLTPGTARRLTREDRWVGQHGSHVVVLGHHDEARLGQSVDRTRLVHLGIGRKRIILNRRVHEAGIDTW